MAVIALLGCYLFVWALFWLPASILVRRLMRDRACPPWCLDLLALVLALCVSYTTFWIYLIERHAGLAASCVVLGLAAAVILLRRWIDPGPLARHMSTPVRVAFLLGLAYLGALTIYGGPERVPVVYVPGSTLDNPSSYFWLRARTGDELIPLKFAHAIATGRPLRGSLIDFPGDWLFSDRPPLQTSVLLTFWPLGRWGRTGILSQAVGTMLQMQWVTALAALAAGLGWGRRRLAFVLLLAGLSGVCYYNAVFVWPKLLAAALAFGAAVPLAAAWRQRRALTGPEILLASSSSALAMLAHGSAAFSLLPLALAGACYRPFRQLRTIVPAAVIAAVLYLPWSAYQKFVDPPGDRCLQWMLAGKTEIDGMSLGQSMREAYGKITLGHWLSERARGLAYLVRCPEMDANLVRCLRGRLDPSYRPAEPFGELYYIKQEDLGYNFSSVAALARYDQVEQVFRALGLLNLAWPVLVWRLLRGPSLRRGGLVLLLAVTLASLVLWWLLVFQPVFLLVRGASMATLVGLMAGASLLIYDLPAAMRWTIAGAHLALGFFLWVVMVPTRFGRFYLQLDAQPHWTPMLVGLAALAGFLFYCLTARVGYRRTARGASEPAGGFPGWQKLGAGLAVIGFLLVAGAAIWTKAPLAKLDSRGCITPRGVPVGIHSEAVMGGAALFDGITDDPASYAAWIYGHPLMVRFQDPQRLQEIRLHWYDFDERVYRFQLEAERDGQWSMLLDRSRDAVGGVVAVPVDARPITAVRIIGLYNSNQELNPENKCVHLKEIEFVPAP